MDASSVLTLLELLDDEIDDLEDSLSPLLTATLAETSSKLPLLDKAKLYVLVTYAIESVLFSYLRLNGVKAQDHPVFIELTRVKQYFEKIKVAEKPVGERNLTLDKGAAGRIIKAGLVGNDKYDLEGSEQQAKERARAHIKFEQVEKRKAEVVNEQLEGDSDLAVEGSDSDGESSTVLPEEPKGGSTSPKKKQKLNYSMSIPNASGLSENSKRKTIKSKKRPKKLRSAT